MQYISELFYDTSRIKDVLTILLNLCSIPENLSLFRIWHGVQYIRKCLDSEDDETSMLAVLVAYALCIDGKSTI